ncbi:hypothetical protein BDZ97DRAFT_1906119 [Flammula alnicola]|nr:hypothetical protein BDZ97DRAFT_1906119 [Flammula alnicola]
MVFSPKSSEHGGNTGTPPTAAVSTSYKHGSLFDKLGDALGASHSTPAPPAVAVPAVPTATKHENLLNKLGDALGASHPTPPPASVAVPAPAPAKYESVLDIIGDALSGDSHKTTPYAPAVAVPHKATSDDLLSKLGETFTGKHTAPAPAPSAPKTTQEQLLDKLSSVISGKKEEPAKPHGLADKINNALGGGAKGEAQEGKLDKAIDLFQEHVLKEGPQNNESALEQAKDKQIANTIRKALGQKEKE